MFKLKDLFRIGNVMLKATPLMAWQWYYIMHTWHDIMLSVGSCVRDPYGDPTDRFLNKKKFAQKWGK